jgi:hypothetical protein
MPFVDDTHPLFAWRGSGGRNMAYMWQLSFPVPLQQSYELAGDKVRLKDMAIQVLARSFMWLALSYVFALAVRRLARPSATINPVH